MHTQKKTTEENQFHKKTERISLFSLVFEKEEDLRTLLLSLHPTLPKEESLTVTYPDCSIKNLIEVDVGPHRIFFQEVHGVWKMDTFMDGVKHSMTRWNPPTDRTPEGDPPIIAFHILYTGLDAVPGEVFRKERKGGRPMTYYTVDVLTGENTEGRLKDYFSFLAKMRDMVNTTGFTDRSFRNTLDECFSQGLLQSLDSYRFSELLGATDEFFFSVMDDLLRGTTLRRKENETITKLYKRGVPLPILQECFGREEEELRRILELV